MLSYSELRLRKLCSVLFNPLFCVISREIESSVFFLNCIAYSLLTHYGCHPYWVGNASAMVAGKMSGGGAKGIRTTGLMIANHSLYQLSYSPNALRE